MRKTLLGDVEKLSSLITDLRYCRSVVTENKGAYSIKPDGHLFVSVPGGVRTAPRTENFHRITATWFLYGKPTPECANAAKTQCVGERLNSIKIIPWPAEGKALVLGRDSSGIGTPWIAFVPLSEVPDPSSFLLEDLSCAARTSAR